MADENYDPYRWPLDLFTSDDPNYRRLRVTATGVFSSFWEERQ